MGHIDDFLVNHVRAHLGAGETVQICAHAREPSNFNLAGAPARNEPWLLVATNYRLFMFKTEVSGMWENHPKPVATDPKVFPFDELASVTTKTMHYGQAVPGGPAKMLLLTPHPRLGPDRGEPVRFDLYGVAEGLDQQARFRGEFPEWLAHQVANGAYPMDPARYQAIMAQAQQEWAAREERNRAAAAKAAETQKKMAKAARPIAAGLLWLGGVVGFGLLAAVGIDENDWKGRELLKIEEEIASTKKVAAKLDDGELPAECAPTDGTCTRWCDHGAIFQRQWSDKGKTPKQSKWRIFKNPGGEDWLCLPQKNLTDSIATDERRHARFSSEVTFARAKVVGGGVGALAWFGLGAGAFAWWKKRKQAAQAAPAA